MQAQPDSRAASSHWLLALPARLADACALAAGYAWFLLTGRSPRLSYHSMRRLYGPTDGALNRALLRLLRRIRPAAPTTAVDGFLGAFTPEQIRVIAAEIEARGFAQLGRAVPAEMCDSLERFARSTPCTGMKKQQAAIYSEQEADALRYDFSEASLLGNPAACRMIFDGTLAAIAGAYFGCRPLYDFSAMWWTTNRGEKAYAEAAQKFHFDMDRPWFLKFFVYLTDVGLETGPHVYVSGSHRDKPRPLREPRRFEDAEVEAAYAPERIETICGPRGMIFAVDTMGLHKGLPVVAGHRLAFQIEFTVSMFGQSYPRAIVSEATLREAGIALPVDRAVYGRLLA